MEPVDTLTGRQQVHESIISIQSFIRSAPYTNLAMLEFRTRKLAIGVIKTIVLGVRNSVAKDFRLFSLISKYDPNSNNSYPILSYLY